MAGLPTHDDLADHAAASGCTTTQAQRGVVRALPAQPHRDTALSIYCLMNINVEN
jgi:hypothetical protein